MKVVLLNPAVRSKTKFIRTWRDQLPAPEGIGIWPPIDLAEIAGCLRRAGFADLVIQDSVIDGDSFESMLDRLLMLRPELVIVHNITPALQDDLEAARILKAHLENVKVVFFGAHATVLPQEILGEAVDYCIRGEPEETAVELVRFLDSGHPRIWEISGLSFFANGLLQHNPDRVLQYGLDWQAPAARDLLDNRKYLLLAKNAPFAIIRVSKGCPYHCIFCTSGFYSRHNYRLRSVESMIDEISGVRREFGINDFMFMADTFTCSRDFVLELCRRLKKDAAGIRWIANSRTDTLTPEIARAMKDSGCWLVSLGIESGDDGILAAAQKGATCEDARRSVRLLKESGIQTIGYFVFGLPGETPETVRKTVDFACGLGLDYAYFFAATPFPGTGLYNLAKKEGWIVSEDWRRYTQGNSNVISLPGMPEKEISAAIQSAYRAFYLRPGRLLREAARIRGIRDFKRCFSLGAKLLFAKFST